MSAVASDVVGAHEPIAGHRGLVPMLWAAELGSACGAEPQTYTCMQGARLVAQLVAQHVAQHVAQLVASAIYLHAIVAGEPATPPVGLPGPTARTAPHSRASRSPFLNSSQLHTAVLTR